MTIEKFLAEIEQAKKELKATCLSLNIDKTVEEITERNIKNLLNPPNYPLGVNTISFADAISEFTEEEREKIAVILGKAKVLSERLFEIAMGGIIKRVGYISTYSQANVFMHLPAKALADELLNEERPASFFRNFLHVIKDIDESYLNKDFEHLFILIDTPNRLPLFNLLFDEIIDVLSPDQFKDLFSDIYIQTEYNFENTNMDAIMDVLKQTDRNIDLIDAEADKDGYYTIYRGEATKSSSLETAYSWSLSQDVALRFAKRFQHDEDDTANRYIHAARVHVDDIILHIKTSENEVLVSYDKLVDIETIPLSDFSDF